MDERIDEWWRSEKKSPSTIMRLRPSTSESAPDGSLRKTPVMVEAATMTPMSSGKAPRSAANVGRTGLRAI
jgi:hypothetical protein